MTSTMKEKFVSHDKHSFEWDCAGLVEQKRVSENESVPAVTSRKTVVIVDHVEPIVSEKSTCCY